MEEGTHTLVVEGIHNPVEARNRNSLVARNRNSVVAPDIRNLLFDAAAVEDFHSRPHIVAAEEDIRLDTGRKWTPQLDKPLLFPFWEQPAPAPARVLLVSEEW